MEKKMIIKRIFPLVVLGIVASQSVLASVSGKKCKTIHYQEGRVFSLKSKLHHATHVILPENMLGKPINGDIDLWNVEGQVKHLFIQPNSNLKEGKTTTVTVIGQSNRSYDFVVTRVTSRADSCVTVSNSGQLLSNNRALSTYISPNERQSQQLQGQVRQLQQQLSNSRRVSQEKAEVALQKYRSYIYTRYVWDQGSGFMGMDSISDVYDDGRFTYIRMKHDNKGLLSVSAEVDGTEEFVEFKFDDKNNIYKVPGIYPAFKLAYGENQKITVTRKDNMTQGQY